MSATQGSIQDIRRFTGYWEYLLERAFIVARPNASFGGSPLVNTQGEIIGVTSLRLGDPPNVNLAIPIEYFLAAKDELFREGRVKSRPPRPWLGLYTVETPMGLVIAGAAPSGPAIDAGFERGDVIVRLTSTGFPLVEATRDEPFALLPHLRRLRGHQVGERAG